MSESSRNTFNCSESDTRRQDLGVLGFLTKSNGSPWSFALSAYFGQGAVRKLGIPTVLDRFVQQALLQVLQGIFEPTFSKYSFGFRPGRSAHQAVKTARNYVQQGRRIVVDVDLSKFSDRVNHDIVMGKLAKKISDKLVLTLVRRYLTAGLLVDGVVVERREGTPQGGPLSPLLANILLDEVDQKLEKRGLAFTRYADDLNVYVKPKRAGQRVMSNLRGLFGRLRLVVNEEKSAVAYVFQRQFLSCLSPEVYQDLAPADRSIGSSTLLTVTRHGLPILGTRLTAAKPRSAHSSNGAR